MLALYLSELSSSEFYMFRNDLLIYIVCMINSADSKCAVMVNSGRERKACLRWDLKQRPPILTGIVTGTTKERKRKVREKYKETSIGKKKISIQDNIKMGFKNIANEIVVLNLAWTSQIMKVKEKVLATFLDMMKLPLVSPLRYLLRQNIFRLC